MRVYFGIIVVAVCCMLIGHAYASVWQSDLTVWERAYQLAPHKSRPAMNYAKALFAVGRDDEANQVAALAGQ